MASSVPHSATLPPPLHSPHSPYSKNRPSAFGSCLEDFDEANARRSSHHSHQQSRAIAQSRIRADGDHTDTDSTSTARWSAHSSHPTSPCADGVSGPTLARGAKPNASTSGLDTPPPFGKTKDERLACRQHMDDTAETTSGDSGRPQKKELRIEECTATACTANRAVFSPASALSATTRSVDTACTGGRDSSIFSFTSSVPDAYMAALTPGKQVSSVSFAGRLPPSLGLTSPTLNANPPPLANAPVPAPPGDAISATADEHSSAEGVAEAEADGASSNRMSKIKQRLRGLNRPAFDLKAVEKAQDSFLDEEEVCNAAQCFPLSEITPLLCIGTWKDAADPAMLRRLGVKYVLNVARELDPAAEANVIAHNKDLIYESIPMSDCHSQDVALHLRQAFQFIERARAARSRVLVHCRRGISRSAAIVVGYLMASEHRSYEDALRFVTERRCCVSLNLAFQERLSEFVPTSEFYHGPPPSPAIAAQTGSATSPAGVLPNLSLSSARSEHGGSFRKNMLSPSASPSTTTTMTTTTTATNTTANPTLLLPAARRSEDLLPYARGAFSASSSNASSRASSTMRLTQSVTSAPATTPSFARTPHRPRVPLTKSKRITPNASSFAAVSATSAGTATTTTAGARSTNRSSWLEEESSSAAPSRHGSTLAQTKEAPADTAVGLRGKPSFDLRHPSSGGLIGFAMPDTSSSSSSSSSSGACDSRSSSSAFRRGRSAGEGEGVEDDDDEVVEEPGSPFGVGNRRAFAHFDFSQRSSSSATNVSPSAHKTRRGFSDAEEDDDVCSEESGEGSRGEARSVNHSTTLPPHRSPNASETTAPPASGSRTSAIARQPSETAQAERDCRRPSTKARAAAQQRLVLQPQPPRLRRRPTAGSGTHSRTDPRCESSEEEEESVAEARPAAPQLSLDKTHFKQPRLAAMQGGRPTLLRQPSDPAAALFDRPHTPESATAPAPAPPSPTPALEQPPSLCVVTAAVKVPHATRATSPTHAGDSCSYTSHENGTVGTLGGLSLTPFGTQGSLLDETLATPNARGVSHGSSLTG